MSTYSAHLSLLQPLTTIADTALGHAQKQDVDVFSYELRKQGVVNALARQTNGKVVVGGQFDYVDGPARSPLIRLNTNGTLDTRFQPTVHGSINCLAVLSNKLYLAGYFTNINGSLRRNLACIDLATDQLTAWSPQVYGTIYDMAVVDNDVYIGGHVSSVNGFAVTNVARIHTGTGAKMYWPVSANSDVMAIAVSSNAVYLAGFFTQVNGADRFHVARVGRSDGVLSAFNPLPNSWVYDLMVYSNYLYVAGNFTAMGVTNARYRLARFNTLANPDSLSFFQPIINDSVTCLAPGPTNTIYAAGSFTTMNGVLRWHVAQLAYTLGEHSAWAPPKNDCYPAAVLQSGNHLVLAGVVSVMGASSAMGVALLDKTSAESKPAPSLYYAGSAECLFRQPDGKLIVGGNFQAVSVAPRKSLVRYWPNGMVDPDWKPMVDGTVYDVTGDGTNTYICGGFTKINDTDWQRLAKLDSTGGLVTAWAPEPNDQVYALELAPAYNALYAGGYFTTIGGLARGHIAKLSPFTGQAYPQFNAMASGTVSVLKMDGSWLHVGGSFLGIGGQSVPRLARLNPTSGAADPAWRSSPDGAVAALLFTNNTLFVGGAFDHISGLNVPCLAKLDKDSAFPVFGWNAGISGELARVAALVQQGSDLYIGGDFQWVGGQSRANLARITSYHADVLGGNPGANGQVNALAFFNGKLLAGGEFTQANGTAQRGLATLDFLTALPWALLLLGD